MSKFTKLAKVIGTLAAKPSALGKVLLDPYEIGFRNRVAQAYGLEKGLPTIDLLDLVPGLDETIDPFCFMNGSSRTVDLAFLKALARRFRGCRYLEIGTLRGESVANVAAVAKECVSISLSDEEILERGWGGRFVENNGLFLRNTPNVKRIGHDSLTFDFSSLGKFDMVFVDGDHSYEAVRHDTQSAFSVLRDENSVIVWHDYGVEYDSPSWRVMAGIVDGTPEGERRRLYHVSNTLCAIYTRGNFATSVVEHPAVPNKVFSVRISARTV